MSASDPDLVRATIAALMPELTETRHYLHCHPELSNHEEQTAQYVTDQLGALDLAEIRTGVGGHGIVATLQGTASGAEKGKVFALRGDMDALPIQEINEGLAYKSSVAGVMHACGHDGHTTTLLGAAKTLSRLRHLVRGQVRFVFQPAEETVGGASEMCKEGAIDGVHAIVALHGWPGMAVGKIGVRSGSMMASADTFDITIKGKGAHAAMPQIGVDPIVVGAQIVTALQTLVSRETAPVEPVVVTIAQFHAGTAYNIIPGTAELKGTVRCLSTAMRELMPQSVERIVAGICAAFRAEYRFGYRFGTPVTVNDAAINALVSNVGSEVLGSENVITLEHPSLGAEDFAVYLERIPGAMFRLGVGADMSPLHTPTYNFADAALPLGVELFTRTALRYLDSD